MKRKRLCKNCRRYFRPHDNAADYVKWCSDSCQESLGVKAVGKARLMRERSQIKAKKAEKRVNARKKREFYEGDIKTRRKAAVREFNRFIRLRDADKPCISCGTTKPVKYDAGHYITAGSCTALRFDEKNVHKQCSWYCNKNLSGNVNGYTQGLIERFDQSIVDYLRGPQPMIKITVEFYQAIEHKYKAKCKDLE